ncbi:Hypothetical predicted protein, partial [Paramuricea clavata]
MLPKRRQRGGSNSSNLFHYNNQVELTFKGQPKEEMLEKVTEVGDSGSDDSGSDERERERDSGSDCEQFPDEILKIRKELYPELKKARDAGKKAKLVKDKLIIE